MDVIVHSQNSSGDLYEKRGLMQRSFEYIFSMMNQEKADAEAAGSEVQYLIKCSYLEIYNEQIMDLLDPHK